MLCRISRQYKMVCEYFSNEEDALGEAKRYLFQNHAVSICERNDGEPITLEEAYFIAGILNTSIVKRFIDASSDNRSFKIRPPVYIPLFNQQDEKHIRIFELAKQAGADAKS